LVVKAGSTETITVKVNTNTTATFSIGLESVTASTDVEMDKIVSNNFEIKDVNTTSVTIDEDGSISNPKL
jgi:hypothetical protein